MELLIAFVILFMGVVGGIIWYLILNKRDLEEIIKDLRITVTDLKRKLRKKEKDNEK